MKKLLTGLTWAAMCLVLNSQGSAQDCCLNNNYDPCCSSRFAGLYLGGNIGFAGYSTVQTDLDQYLEDASSYSATHTSWAGGFQLGYNWESCNRLLGLVIDWDWSDTKTHVRLEPNTPTLSQSIQGRLRWFSTFRARAGLVANDVLLYFTGGAALANLETEITNIGGIATERSALNKHRWGWTAGIGTEFDLGCRWSLNAEILYLNFDSTHVSFLSDVGTNFGFDFNDSVWVGRVGLNYRFSLCSLCSCWFL